MSDAKGVLSMNDTNFDIFISFKDRDNDSNRTVSSRLAEDIYDTLEPV